MLNVHVDMPFFIRMTAAVAEAAETAPAEQSSACAVRALVDVIQKEETAIVVNLDDRIQVCINLVRCVP